MLPGDPDGAERAPDVDRGTGDPDGAGRAPDVDDLGERVRLPRPPRRVVSLVPSLTEAVATTAPGLLAGATDYCTHPADLDVARVGGSKWPDLDRVRACRPDLVLANAEENRREDVAALRAAGVPVWVTNPRTVPASLASLDRALAACGLGRPAWLDAADAVWAGPVPAPRRRAAVPIWRRPWMVLDRDTFAGDVLARLGVANVFADAVDRYPRTTVEAVSGRRPDLLVLPDEPYAFGVSDGPEAFPSLPVAFVDGRSLTWYGPSLVTARSVLAAAIAAARPS